MSFAIKRFRWANYSVLVHLNFSNFRMCVCVCVWILKKKVAAAATSRGARNYFFAFELYLPFLIWIKDIDKPLPSFTSTSNLSFLSSFSAFSSILRALYFDQRRLRPYVFLAVRALHLLQIAHTLLPNVIPNPITHTHNHLPLISWREERKLR